MAIDLRPYFDALGIPRSVLRVDDQGRVVGVGNMAIIPSTQQPRMDRAAIAQAIQTLRQSLPDPAEGIQAAMRAVAQVAPLLGQIAQQLPTTLQARQLAAELTGFLPGGRPTEARQARLAQQAIARAQIAAQQEANRLRAAQAAAELLLSTAQPGQTITLTPEQQAQLGPFASFLQGRTIPATTGAGALSGSDLRLLYRDLQERLNQLSDPMRLPPADPAAQQARAVEIAQVRRQMAEIEPQLFPNIFDPVIHPLRAEVDLMRAQGLTDADIRSRLLAAGFTPQEIMEAGVAFPTIGPPRR